MKIDTNTSNVLKNFSEINPSLYFKAGNVLKTISPAKNIIAEAQIDPTIPQDFGIYDLTQFLALASAFGDDADVEFEAKNMIISDGDRRLRYLFAAANLIILPPDNIKTLENVVVNFKLSEDNVKSILQMKSLLMSNEVIFECENGKFSVSVTDADNQNSNYYRINLTDLEGTSDFKLIFKADNFKMMPQDYNVEVSSKDKAIIANFVSDDEKLKYWIAIESKSSV